MFEIKVPARDHGAILKNLRSIPYMESESETQYTMKHPTGLVAEFHVHGEKLTVDIIENPEDVTEEAFKTQIEANLKELSKSTK